MSFRKRLDTLLKERAIKDAIKDVEMQLEAGEANGEPLTCETEMLLREELDRLEYMLFRHNL
jgi:hypothetical protein